MPRPDRNFWYLLGDAGLFSLAAVCFDPTVVLSVFVAQLTTSPILIGAPAAIRIAGLYLPQLPVALGVRHFQHMQGFFFWQAAIGRGALLGCVLGAVLSDALGPGGTLALVLVAWAIFSFTEGAATLAWLDLIGDVMDPRLRGRYFGLVQSVGGVLSLGAGLGVRQALGPDLSALTFGGVFAWGFAAFALSVVCIGLVREPREKARPVIEESSLSHVGKLLRGADLVRLCSAQILGSSLQLALPSMRSLGETSSASAENGSAVSSWRRPSVHQ